MIEIKGKSTYKELQQVKLENTKIYQLESTIYFPPGQQIETILSLNLIHEIVKNKVISVGSGWINTIDIKINIDGLINNAKREVFTFNEAIHVEKAIISRIEEVDFKGYLLDSQIEREDDYTAKYRLYYLIEQLNHELLEEHHWDEASVQALKDYTDMELETDFL